MTDLGVTQLWRNFLGNFPFKIGFWHSPKMGRMGVGGGPSAKRRHGGCCVAPGKTAGTGSPAPPGACFMQIPASESLLFLFSLTEGANSGQIWRSGQTHVLETEWTWLMGVAHAILVLSGEATCCIVLEWYLVHVPSYGRIIWLKHEEMETNF